MNSLNTALDNLKKMEWTKIWNHKPRCYWIPKSGICCKREAWIAPESMGQYKPNCSRGKGMVVLQCPCFLSSSLEIWNQQSAKVAKATWCILTKCIKVLSSHHLISPFILVKFSGVYKAMDTHIETLGSLQSKLEFSKSFGLDYITQKMGTLIDCNFFSFFPENRKFIY